MATSARPDPWTIARRALPGYALLRIIDLDRQEQAFKIVRADRGDLECTEYLLDGATLIRPEGDRSAADREAIIRDYDALWLATHAAYTAG